MARVLLILATCTTLAGGALWLACERFADAARAAARETYGHRSQLLAPLRAAAAKPPAVLWIGDSILLPAPGVPSCARLAAQNMKDVRARQDVLIWPGIDAFGYWALAGRVAATRPLAVVLVANLRAMKPDSAHYADLVGEVDWADLPAGLALPYAVRGLTAPRLLLARALTTPGGEDALFVLEGLRRLAHDADAWKALGTSEPPVVLASRLRTVNAVIREYDRPFGPRQAMVRYLTAAVERIARSGAPVLVVVAPVPWEGLAYVGHYDQERFEARVAVLRAGVEAAGGELLDLHRALTKADFRDAGGHFSAIGTQRVAGLLGARVRAILTARHPVLVPSPPPRSATDPLTERRPESGAPK